MSDENITNSSENQESEIDLMELAMTLWKQRRKIIKWCICGAVIGLIVAFSIPKEYTTSVALAPEWNNNKSSNTGLSALASMAGLNLGSSGGTEALFPILYPDVVRSVPFITGLFDVKVRLSEEDSTTMTVQQYVTNEVRAPWWSYIMGLPGQLIGMMFSSDEEGEQDHKLDNFNLTQEEFGLYMFLQNSIAANYDMKTAIVSISVTMQDPLVSALLADTVVTRLQEYITDYRTNKARQDLEYELMLNENAKKNYYEAQQKYAEFLDRNQGLAFHISQTEKERLANESSLAFNLYNQTAQRVQAAQAKVQETTPAYAVITPATVPLYASRPRKAMILIGFTFLAFVACAAWILFGQPMLKNYREKINAEKQQDDSDATETKE
ncbi:MAG: chain-length determining protein [Muribaculaceae bacterium]|nr:chain-length determining protein [Muribaculaceae bacterium]